MVVVKKSGRGVRRVSEGRGMIREERVGGGDRRDDDRSGGKEIKLR
jgi:hypothetical protein